MDQSSINACSANATPNVLSLSNKVDNIIRLYFYVCTRWLDNNQMLPVQDQGDTLRNAFTSLSCYHYIDEQKYEYMVEKVNDFIPPEVFKKLKWLSLVL